MEQASPRFCGRKGTIRYSTEKPPGQPVIPTGIPGKGWHCMWRAFKRLMAKSNPGNKNNATAWRVLKMKKHRMILPSSNRSYQKAVRGWENRASILSSNTALAGPILHLLWAVALKLEIGTPQTVFITAIFFICLFLDLKKCSRHD